MANAGPPRGLRITTPDEYLARAAKEYQEGHIDQALWARVSARSGEDEELVVADYLRARATALQLKKRDGRPEALVPRSDSMDRASDPQVDAQSRAEVVSAEAAGAAQRGGKPKIKHAVAAVALATVVAVVWLVASPRDSGSDSQPAAVAAAVHAGPPASPANQQPVASAAQGPASQGYVAPSLETKVQELKNAGNWNVLVLYAGEWTRKEPGNAAAWAQLSMGFAELRQLGDALEAGTKAADLSPEDPRHWRNLGHVNFALWRLPEARIAFDKALAATPDDADALCGAALVAKNQGRAKDADGLVARLKSMGARCDDPSDTVSSPVVAGGAADRNPARSRSR